MQGSGDAILLPSQIYHQRQEKHRLLPDKDQTMVLPIIDTLATGMRTPMVRSEWRKVGVWRAPGDGTAPKGLYLHGPVGRGKSMLMQLLFDAVPIQEKRRVHFHPFMEELQQRMFKARPPGNVDLVLHMASSIAEEARLLCFDEFFVTTIADGILLGRLLEALFNCGVTVCATSNWAPDDLYQDGTNRQSVLPFIDMLKCNVRQVALSDGPDWRRSHGHHARDEHLTAETLYRDLTGHEPQSVEVTLRSTQVAAKGVAMGIYWFDFMTLCSRVIGRAEYMELCKEAKGVFLSGIPILKPELADTAMRFIVLVDLLYEYRIPMRIFSEGDLDHICTDGPVAQTFQRTVSRIHELSRCEWGILEDSYGVT